MEETFVAPRASGPNMAEAKMISPPPTKSAISIASGLSMRAFPPAESLGHHLGDIGEHGRDENDADNGEDRDADAFAERVGHECYGRDSERERHGAGLRHIKAGRRDIEPEKCQESAEDGGGKGREVHLVLRERDDGVRSEYRAEYAAREAVDAVYDARSIDGKRYEDKERNDEAPYLEGSVEWYAYRRHIEFIPEPPTDEQRKHEYDEKAVRNGNAFALRTDDEQVVYKAGERADEERRERYPRLIAREKIQF